jgi:hypothetical protein
MLDTWGSDLIVGLMAALLGGTFRIFAIVVPPTRPNRNDRREGETLWSAAMRRAEEDKAASLPKSAKLATMALYGLVAVIWISVAISPVEWRWIAFVVGTAVGYVVVELAFRAGMRTGGAQPPTATPRAT